MKFDWACDSALFLHAFGNSLASTCWSCAMRELLKREGKKKDNFFCVCFASCCGPKERERLKWRVGGGRVKVTGYEQDGFETVSNKI